MYKLKAEGVVFYDPSSEDMSLQVLSPKASYELNQPGSLEFTLLPGSVVYNGLHKLKTVVTLEQDGELIFRGRVLETETDLYNRKIVYCEGELAFLLDSVQRPYKFKGKAADLFRQLVTKHNEQAEEYKQFQIGMVTAVDDDDTVEVEGDSYADTLSDIRSLLIDQHGGYLRIRHEDGARYIDYVDALNQSCSQEITFGVNILDIENKVNAQDVCTVLIPLGKDNLTIEKVNGKKDYIEDAELVAKYGRIVKSCTWDDVTDAGKLLFLGQEYMQKMKADTTLTITALDLRAAGADVDGIRIGDTVKLNSLPHGLDKEDICAQIELDIENPEKSEYTFGLPRVTLTAAHANAVKSLSEKMWHTHRWLTETETALTINVEATNLIGHRTTQLEIDVDAAEEAITLKASQQSVDILEEKNNEVMLRLDAAEDSITAKADKVRVEALETEITGLVKVDELSAQVVKVVGESHFGRLSADAISAEGSVSSRNVNTGSITADSIRVGGNLVATEAWVSENFSKASATYMPTMIERYGDVTGTSIPVRTLNESGTELLTGTVDAGDVYNTGWNDCRNNAQRQQVLINYYPAGETLYDRDGNVATGTWYKGTEAYRYSLPSAKT